MLVTISRLLISFLAIKTRQWIQFGVLCCYFQTRHQSRFFNKLQKKQNIAFLSKHVDFSADGYLLISIKIYFTDLTQSYVLDYSRIIDWGMNNMHHRHFSFQLNLCCFIVGLQGIPIARWKVYAKQQLAAWANPWNQSAKAALTPFSVFTAHTGPNPRKHGN